jgi:hypothetical protein
MSIYFLLFFLWPNAQRSAAGLGSPTTILPENSEAHFLIRAKCLGGQLQRMVGRFSKDKK